jgi:hypothetical protein
MATTTQKKNTMIPGTVRPAMVLALATAGNYPSPHNLLTNRQTGLKI